MEINKVINSTIVKTYHQQTKHYADRPARSSGYMDWANQPVPFRCYSGAREIQLPLIDKDPGLPYNALYKINAVSPINLFSISTLLSLSMGLSAWKKYESNEWALRINPSSGNLHPTECYLLLPGFSDKPACLAHYHPYLHILQETAILNQQQCEDFNALGGFGLILTSITWREAWKYGERAYRYCQHDVGHALAALRFACNLNGWKMTLIPQVHEQELNDFLALDTIVGEEECADCLCWIDVKEIDSDSISQWFKQQKLLNHQHKANRLSAQHVDWEIIKRVQQASRSQGQVSRLTTQRPESNPAQLNSPYGAEDIIRKRRSAQRYSQQNSKTDMPVFLHMLSRTLASKGCPFDLFPYPSRVHLILFVHAINGLESGLYIWLRNTQHLQDLKQQCHTNFDWLLVEKGYPLYRLEKGNFREKAQTISCNQAIAGDSAFSLGMIAQFDAVIDEDPSSYPRLFWETGLIGQVLYLEAEAFDLRGTGIGCFFDDQLHDLLGVKNKSWQSLYHFTVGKPLDDLRLETKAPYYHLRSVQNSSESKNTVNSKPNE
ncbi:SagB/ThcOx family dehydrogenase [Psychromonas sp.]|uniref:SagB/ThcOx family dehydrogenase n=1 Tax=Psychromonas sp. TaxID=1884585 RepID=UPI003566C7EF